MLTLFRDRAWRAEFARGVRDMLPTSPGILAWALVTGVAMAKSSLGITAAIVMSLLAYAGSAQLAALPLLATAAPMWVIAVTAFMTNMRFVIYAAALRGWLVDYSVRYRLLLGYLSGDFSFVLFMNRVAHEGAFVHRDAWLLGMTTLNWLLWQVASIAGIIGASFIPTNWGLQFAGTLALVALVVPSCTRAPGAAGAIAAGATALAGRHWPLKAGLLAGVVVGLVVATTTHAMLERQPGERT